jgi:hypothetical protein
LKDGTYLRLGENSALEILTLDNNSYQFYLTEGRAYANFRGLKDSLLQMDTPVSSLRVYDRSRFGVDVSEDGYTDISAYRGSVYAEGEDGKTQIEAGKTLSLKEKGYAEISPSGPSDPWERWNRERDRRFADRRPPSTYLPEELSPYSNDFEQNGKWVYESEYGYVWTPTVVVSAGWAPYRVGRWVWIGGDYVWISYEPWGWVPYHYGRWAFVTSIGWCWVPPVRVAIFWGPGFVGWVQTPTYVSWVPLAPGEIYYGHGNYGTQTTLEGIEKSKTTMEEIEKPKATRKEIQKSKPMGGEIEKSKTTKEGLERPKSIREGTEKPKLTKEEIEKPKAGGEGIEEPKEFKPTGSGVGKTREFKPQKKGIQKSKELEPVEKRIEKRHKPLEKEAEKPGS